MPDFAENVSMGNNIVYFTTTARPMEIAADGNTMLLYNGIFGSFDCSSSGYFVTQILSEYSPIKVEGMKRKERNIDSLVAIRPREHFRQTKKIYGG